jgi:hypothetical protein
MKKNNINKQVNKIESTGKRAEKPLNFYSDAAYIVHKLIFSYVFRSSGTNDNLFRAMSCFFKFLDIAGLDFLTPDFTNNSSAISCRARSFQHTIISII